MTSHRPVMLERALTELAVRADGCYVDATFGRGGHARALLGALGPDGRVIAMDRDPDATAAAEVLAREDQRFTFVRACYTTMGDALSAPMPGRGVDGVLFDLGVSSPQLDAPARGFSFQSDGPLDMRMDPSQGETAAEWINRASADEIADALFHYGDEKRSRRIGRAIVEARSESRIETTARLAEVIARALGGRRGRTHPATRSFQAIRIVINNELDRVASGLARAVDVLAPHGRLVVISFHSIEDRLVKRFIRDAARSDVPSLRPLGKAQMPTNAEISENPRARSAVLRTAERLP